MGRVEQGKLMKYRFEIEAKNYEDFASGRVLYNRKGATAFPVRLGSEIIQRCLGASAGPGKVPDHLRSLLRGCVLVDYHSPAPRQRVF